MLPFAPLPAWLRPDESLPHRRNDTRPAPATGARNDRCFVLSFPPPISPHAPAGLATPWASNLLTSLAITFRIGGAMGTEIAQEPGKHTTTRSTRRDIYCVDIA